MQRGVGGGDGEPMDDGGHRDDRFHTQACWPRGISVPPQQVNVHWRKLPYCGISFVATAEAGRARSVAALANRRGYCRNTVDDLLCLQLGE